MLRRFKFNLDFNLEPCTSQGPQHSRLPFKRRRTPGTLPPTAAPARGGFPQRPRSRRRIASRACPARQAKDTSRASPSPARPRIPISVPLGRVLYEECVPGCRLPSSAWSPRSGCVARRRRPFRSMGKGLSLAELRILRRQDVDPRRHGNPARVVCKKRSAILQSLAEGETDPVVFFEQVRGVPRRKSLAKST